VVSLREKVAIVTGGGGGIGSATAGVLADCGAKVVVADIDLAAAERVAAEINARGGVAQGVYLDLADEDTILAMIRAAVTTFGKIDILHNNAADLSSEFYPRDRDIESMDVEVWDRTFRVNVRGTMLCCKHALPQMPRHAGASIINTTSNLGLQGSLIQAAYSASKAALLQLTRSIATSHGKQGIRCNAVSPGLVLTPNVASTIPAPIREIVEAETLTPRLGEPKDIAYVVAFLASDEARYITGQNIVVDGGTASHIPGFAAMRTLFQSAQSREETTC
jgi:NAD(P)-dependent dehydrogenase (short-subunit alcohol dehydrogenase family)